MANHRGCLFHPAACALGLGLRHFSFPDCITPIRAGDVVVTCDYTRFRVTPHVTHVLHVFLTRPKRAVKAAHAID